MFVDPKTSKATLKRSELQVLTNASMLLEQIGKFAALSAASEASKSVRAVILAVDPPAATPAA